MVCKLNTIHVSLTVLVGFIVQADSSFELKKKDQIGNIKCISESQCTLFKKWEKFNTSIFGTLVLGNFVESSAN